MESEALDMYWDVLREMGFDDEYIEDLLLDYEFGDK